MNRYGLIALILAFALMSGCSERPSETYTKLVWSDEFDGGALDSEKWRAMIGTGPEEGYPAFWGNDEKQFYRAENALEQNNWLVIQIKRQEYEGMQYTSARLTTSKLYAFTYGYVEARIKLPTGIDGIWPALWLLPDGLPNEWSYGGWAASGEIDILESKSRVPGEISGAAHFGGQWPANTYKSGTYSFPKGTDAGDWHIYGFEWSADKMTWYVDGVEYFHLDDWYTIVNNREYKSPKPFDKAFCLVLNGAVGGRFDEGRLPDEDFTEAEILVDWIRIYQ